MKDEIMQELWKAKDTIAARHHYNVRRLTEYLNAAAPPRLPICRSPCKANPNRRTERQARFRFAGIARLPDFAFVSVGRGFLIPDVYTI